jgi:diguanylate cyclase (GGDEF)-like protein
MMRESPAERVGGPPQVQRWVAAALAVILLILTAAAMAGSWRQAEIAESMAAESTRTDAYQRASYLAALEIGLLQGTLRDPHGEERDALSEVAGELQADLAAMAAHTDAYTDANRDLVRIRLGLQPAIDNYLALSDRGTVAAAQELLENDIEPVYEEFLETLRDEQDDRVEQYAERLARAKQDSRLLQLGTVLTFVLGLAVLSLLAWSRRTHRRVIERMAAHDSLTGLPNRAAFHARAVAALTRVKPGGFQPTALMLDLDGFKDVNDSLGHHMGDLLLTQVAQRLRGCIRPHDTVARLGGDEFAILLVDAEPATGELAAERIAHALNKPFVIDGIVLDIEASVGIVTASPGDDVATVLRYADTAMYAAKEHRLGHTRFDPAQANDTAARLTMLGDLRRALDTDGEIELHYQPKVSVDTGEVIGAEALARWRHPTKGMIQPNDFIPVLEGTSLVRRFTTQVLDLALAQARTWVDAGHHIPVAVNVSTRCLLDATFADGVADALATADVPGTMLCIEITENTVMSDPERAIEVLHRIRALGVKTAIDDFGTGYSSMAYLKILPVDEIKVDRSFVRDMATERSNYVLVESAVDLGHNLGLAVVAEGVENEPIVAALQELGCDVAQGYHFARPLPAHELTAMLSHQTAPQPRTVRSLV